MGVTMPLLTAEVGGIAPEGNERGPVGIGRKGLREIGLNGRKQHQHQCRHKPQAANARQNSHISHVMQPLRNGETPRLARDHSPCRLLATGPPLA